MAVETVVAEIKDVVEKTMAEDEGTGGWVGMMGFSQGAKVVGSWLLEQQLRLEEEAKQGEKGGAVAGVGMTTTTARTDFKFGVLMAGSAPLASLSGLSDGLVVPPPSSGFGKGFPDFDAVSAATRVRVPTLHILGLADPGLHRHRQLLEHCEPSATTLVEWEGDHRIAFMSKDVDVQVKAIWKVARKAGVRLEEGGRG